MLNKIFIAVLLFFLIYFLSYFISYVRYDNREMVNVNAILEENNILKKEMLELSGVSLTDGVLAKVIFRDFYSFYDNVFINLGSDDGVEKSSAVINENGLIGIVNKVYKNRSSVNLLSSDYNISIKVNGEYGNYCNGIVTMVDKYSDVRVGDIIYTSGLDDVVGGIYVGKVSEVKIDADGLGKFLKVDYLENKNLNYVYVVGKVE